MGEHRILTTKSGGVILGVTRSFRETLTPSVGLRQVVGRCNSVQDRCRDLADCQVTTHRKHTFLLTHYVYRIAALKRAVSLAKRNGGAPPGQKTVTTPILIICRTGISRAERQARCRHFRRGPVSAGHATSQVAVNY